jgi:hypothetical protein
MSDLMHLVTSTPKRIRWIGANTLATKPVDQPIDLAA